MFARIYSGGLVGVDAYRIEVEVDCSGGIGQIQIVGLPDASVKESQERVRAAIKSCSFLMPPAKKWIVNMAPADTRKEGPLYDLPIAVGILASSDLINKQHLSKFWIVGELGLDGSMRPVTGILPIVLAAKANGAESVIIPEQNADEAALVEGISIYPVSHLLQACLLLNEPGSIPAYERNMRQRFNFRGKKVSCVMDLREVKGQYHAKER